MMSSEPFRVLGCVSDVARNSAFLLLSDWRVVWLPGWTFSLEQSQFVGQLERIEGMEPPVLLKLFGRQLAVCSYERISLLDVVTGETSSSLTLIEERRIRACNVRMIESRICAEWITAASRADGTGPSLTYRLADCLTGERLYEYRFSEEEVWSLPWHRHSMTLGVNLPSKGIVWYLRDHLNDPFAKFFIRPFEDNLDVLWSDSQDTFCAIC